MSQQEQFVEPPFTYIRRVGGSLEKVYFGTLDSERVLPQLAELTTEHEVQVELINLSTED